MITNVERKVKSPRKRQDAVKSRRGHKAKEALAEREVLVQSTWGWTSTGMQDEGDSVHIRRQLETAKQGTCFRDPKRARG